MRLRLLLIFTLLMATALLALGVPLARGIAGGEAQTLHLDRLRDVVRFTSLAQPGGGPPDDVAQRALTTDLARYTSLYGIDVAVVDPAGQVYVGNLGRGEAEPRTMAATAAALAGRVGEEPGRLWPWSSEPFVVAQPMVSDGDVVGAVVSVSDPGPARARVLRGWATLAGLGLLALLLAVLLAARLARWVMRPVGLLESAAHGIAGGDFGTRVAGRQGPPELRHLATSFNEMADHVQAVLAAQRTFVADAGHQLRNPLNALLLRLEVARHEKGDPAAVEAATLEGRHLAATLDRMLEMARAEHATAEPTRVDVAAVVDERLASWRVVAGRRSVTLSREGPARAEGWQDAVALAGAVDAVVDNALKFSPESGEVLVRVATPATGGVVVEVADRGPGMTEAELVRAGERYWRGDDRADVSGSGLGLPIAAMLLERYGGGLEVRRRDDGPGLTVRLRVAPAPPDGRSDPPRRRLRRAFRRLVRV